MMILQPLWQELATFQCCTAANKQMWSKHIYKELEVDLTFSNWLLDHKMQLSKLSHKTALSLPDFLYF